MLIRASSGSEQWDTVLILRLCALRNLSCRCLSSSFDIRVNSAIRLTNLKRKKSGLTI